MDQETFTAGMAITLFAALISCGNAARAEIQTTQIAIQEEIGLIGGSASRTSFTSAVINRKPKDHLTQLSNDQNHIYYFTELKGLTRQNVSHR